jgi:hypothetical protein
MLRRVVLLIALMMETVSTSETSVSHNQTTPRNIPEDSHRPQSISLCEFHIFRNSSVCFIVEKWNEEGEKEKK